MRTPTALAVEAPPLTGVEFGGILKPDAILRPPAPADSEISSMMNTLWRLNCRPGTFREVPSRYLSAIMDAWNDYGEFSAANCGKNTIIFKISPASRDNWGHFCIYDTLHPERSSFGFLTDRESTTEWPEAWQSYEPYRGGRILDHCCGDGTRVRTLESSGYAAFGTDATAFDSRHPRIMFSYEYLPFKDGTFGLVESRFGSLFTARLDRPACLRQFNEMVRVTAPGGLVRVYPLDSSLARYLLEQCGDNVTGVEHSPAAWCFKKRE